MDSRREKKLTYITIGLIFLLSGVEYAVILPTIWRFLQTLDAAPYFLGLVLSAFSLSGLLSGPLFGHWSDRTRSTKKIILFANIFEIVGNFMYLMGYSKWLLLSSRLVAGIGAGVSSSIFGFLTRSTAPEDRATVFAAFMACRQAGLVIGPAFNIFLRLCDFHLGPFVINKYTAPGVRFITCQYAFIIRYVEESDEEGKPLIVSQELMGSYGSVVASSPPRNTTLNPNPSPHSPVSPAESSGVFKNFSISREFLREEVIVLLAAQFVTFFNQTALETMVTPLTQKYFSFGELENSVMYFLGGVVVIAGFLFVRWLSRHVTERVILAIGLCMCNISCIWCLIFLAKPLGGFAWQLTEFIIGVFLQILGLPFVSVAQVSLFSKITAEKTQGFSQGIRRSVGGLATILGPLWAGGLTENMYVMMGMMTVLLVLLTVSNNYNDKTIRHPARG
uniref:Major facilitator superfamily domain-containing protein 8-like n=1 Tax=Pundamilia nyererei TaxID=303518 RepID=A0A3B4H1I8_9CICH